MSGSQPSPPSGSSSQKERCALGPSATSLIPSRVSELAGTERRARTH